MRVLLALCGSGDVRCHQKGQFVETRKVGCAVCRPQFYCRSPKCKTRAEDASVSMCRRRLSSADRKATDERNARRFGPVETRRKRWLALYRVERGSPCHPPWKRSCQGRRSQRHATYREDAGLHSTSDTAQRHEHRNKSDGVRLGCRSNQMTDECRPVVGLGGENLHRITSLWAIGMIF